MLYNNPVSYKTDFLPEQIKELAEENANLHAVKESSADVRRVTALKAICGDRLKLFVGVDDAIVEGVRAGAVGWIAGLVNAFPKESVALYNYAIRGEAKKRTRFTNGFCRCCEWTRFQSSSSLSNWCSRKSAGDTNASARRAA
jgi:dihydrodipicolinate synthase/N-acetylneuraminate lyase